MGRLSLSIAVGDYDRVRALVDGVIRIDGVEPVFSLLEPEEIFFRAFRHADFDVCELSLSSFTIKTAAGDCPYVGVPIFPSRAFRHTSIYVRTDRIRSPAELRGKRVGVPEYQVTANVWVRAMLEQEYGIAPRDLHWVRGGYEQPGRPEKIRISLPPDVRIEDAPPDATISGMLADGRLDAVIGPRAPSCFGRGDVPVDWLFADPMASASAWYRRTRIFPIMHMLGVRRTLAEKYQFLPASLAKAFHAARLAAVARLEDMSATKITLPFVEEQVRAARALMGHDYWPDGLEANRHVLQAFLAAHHAQGLSSRALRPEELFHPSTWESFAI